MPILLQLLVISAYCQQKEIARIDYKLRGCFGSELNEILIYRDKNIVKAKFKKDGKSIVESTLTNYQLDTLYSFIKELKALKYDGVCTTVQYFTVRTKGETFKKVDESCSWEGYENLKRALFKF